MPTRPPVHRPTYCGPPAPRRRAAFDRERGSLRVGPNGPSAASRGHDHRWRAFRAAALAASPLCADCLARGVVTPATEAHHVAKLRDAPERRLDPSNVMSLCRAHHSMRTGRGEWAATSLMS